ncbi:hypothetical protein [Succinimonas sp.]|uniref:hypothetical protein n=1 Tax=Succinimonas sp. TaxID=1936151 RepID=UPI00386634A0
MNASQTLLQRKYARVIACFAQKSGLSRYEALDFFYRSELCPLIHEGSPICMSDDYLAGELLDEYNSAKSESVRHPDDGQAPEKKTAGSPKEPVF